MRLGQLARKLSVKPAEIVDFLAARNIKIDDGGNTKIEDDHVTLIMQQYAVAPEREETHPIEVIALPPSEEGDSPENKLSDQIEIPAKEVIEEEKIEVIKAPKVELSGLKILGKIDLPEPKKKETLQDVTDAEAPPEVVKQPRPELKKQYPQRRERPGSARKNPIALQRENEVTEARKKRETEREREKEKRTLHYLSKVNVAQPAKTVKAIHDDPPEERQVVAAKAPTTWWGRFIKWLNT